MNAQKQLVKELRKLLQETPSRDYRSFRSTNLRYVNDPISALGSAIVGGRFNPKKLEALYTSLEIETMIAEMQHYAHTDPRLAGRFRPSSILTLESSNIRALDLTNTDIQTLLGTNPQELSGHFIRMQNRGFESPTQLLGRLNIEHGFFDAFIAESARADNGKNLIVFPSVASQHNCTITLFDPENVLPTIRILP